MSFARLNRSYAAAAVRRERAGLPQAMSDTEIGRRIDALNRQIGYGLPSEQALIPLALEARARGLV